MTHFRCPAIAADGNALLIHDSLSCTDREVKEKVSGVECRNKQLFFINRDLVFVQAKSHTKVLLQMSHLELNHSMMSVLGQAAYIITLPTKHVVPPIVLRSRIGKSLPPSTIFARKRGDIIHEYKSTSTKNQS